ncbi:unnamed protein product, partial [marine sediment metagenome]
MALPLVAGAIGMLSLASLKRLLLQFGPKLLKIMIGAAAFKELMDLIGLGAPDATLVKVKPGEVTR